MLQFPSKICGLLKQISTPITCQTRNTFILKRHYPIRLAKRGKPPRHANHRLFTYDLIEDTTVARKHENMEVILTTYVPGLGYSGDTVSIKPHKAYTQLLLPGLAVYKTPDNINKYKQDPNIVKKQYSSPTVEKTIRALEFLIVNISMNKHCPWVLQPWHIRATFRKFKFEVPEHAIEMPPGEIRGPDMSLQDKEFFITVTINNTEKVPVRCRINHWALGEERIPWSPYHWQKPSEAIFPEQAEVLRQIEERGQKELARRRQEKTITF